MSIDKIITINLLDDLADSMKKVIGRSILRRKPGNPYLEEVLVHMQFLKLKAKEHVRRDHLLEKVIHYMTRQEPYSLPPFLLDGDVSTGKTSILAKVLQQMSQKSVDATVWYYKEGGEASHRNCNESDDPNDYSDLDLPQQPPTPIYPLFQQGKYKFSPPKLIQPVLVARVIGLTPEASSMKLLIQSLSYQICTAYGVNIEDDTELNIELFRDSLHLASALRPLIIVLAKIDRLDCHGPMNQKLSMLLEVIPPYVRFVFSAKTNLSFTSNAAIITDKILMMVPLVVQNARKALGIITLPPETDYLAEREHYFLNSGEIIAPIVRTYIHKYAEMNGRKLHIDHENWIFNAFFDAQKGENGVIPLRLLKLLYQLSRSWKSEDSISSLEFPRTIVDAFSLIFENWENKFGFALTSNALIILVCSRDGITQSELEDMLSLHDDVLVEVFRVRYWFVSFALKYLNIVFSLISRECCGYPPHWLLHSSTE
jgi:hypothetical protein